MSGTQSTVVQFGDTVTIDAEVSAVDYTVYGTLEVDGTLTTASVGGEGVRGSNASLVVNGGGLAMQVSLDDYGGVDVRSGGSIEGLAQINFGTGYANTDQANGTTVTVAAGGSLTQASLVGGTATVAGQASNLNTTGERLTVTGSVIGLDAAGYQITNEVSLAADTTINHGGSITGGAFYGVGTLRVQGASTLANSTVGGGFIKNGSGYPYVNGAQMLQEDIGGEVIGVALQGTCVAHLAGLANQLTVDDSSAAYIQGFASNTKVTPASDSVLHIYGLTTTFDHTSLAGPAPGEFAGLAVQSGGLAGNIVDQGLVVVENGGRTVDTQVDGIQAVDAGGVANDTLVDAGGTVLDSGSLTYDTGGTFVDRGNIVAETLPTYGLTATAGEAPPPMITYGAGNVVQDGTGALVLEGSNSYSGGTMLDQGTLEIGSATGAGTGGIAFGTAHAATLRLDAAALTEGTFANTVSGLRGGDVIDVAGTPYALLDRAVVQGDALKLETFGGKVEDTIAVDPGTGTSVAFLALPDGHGGTALLVIPDTLSALTAAFGAPSPSTLASLATDVFKIASTSTSSLPELGFGVTGVDGKVIGATLSSASSAITPENLQAAVKTVLIETIGKAANQPTGIVRG